MAWKLSEGIINDLCHNLLKAFAAKLREDNFSGKPRFPTRLFLFASFYQQVMLSLNHQKMGIVVLEQNNCQCGLIREYKVNRTVECLVRKKGGLLFRMLRNIILNCGFLLKVSGNQTA